MNSLLCVFYALVFCHKYCCSYVTNLYSDNIKFCKNCKHFIPPKDNSLIENGNCALYTDVNLVSGEKHFRKASSVRVFNSECGKEARFYVEKRKYIRKTKNPTEQK